MDIIKSFGGVRHYLDWEKLEPEKGNFTFNPAKAAAGIMILFMNAASRKVLMF